VFCSLVCLQDLVVYKTRHSDYLSCRVLSCFVVTQCVLSCSRETRDCKTSHNVSHNIFFLTKQDAQDYKTRHIRLQEKTRHRQDTQDYTTRHKTTRHVIVSCRVLSCLVFVLSFTMTSGNKTHCVLSCLVLSIYTYVYMYIYIHIYTYISMYIYLCIYLF